MDIALEGTWQMLRAEMRGETAPEMVTSHTVVTLAAGRYAVSYGGHVADAGTYEEQGVRGDADVGGEAGGSGEFRTLLLRGVEGPNAGRSIPCIFQLKGDRLRVCYGLDGVRPGEFVTRSGDERYLATYRRVAAGGAEEEAV